MQHIGGVFYINLDKRTDRRFEIESEFERMGISGERFSAIVDSPGIVGCSKSHLAVLKEARRRNLPNVLIFEDDFLFLVSKEVLWERINEFFNWYKPFDVVMLGYAMGESEPIDKLIIKVLSAATASAYIVDAGFYDTLIDLYEISIPKLISTGDHSRYANDRIWSSLQPENRWYAFKERLGKQRDGFSDNWLTYTYAFW
jgi:glycosyl transferase family 25